MSVLAAESPVARSRMYPAESTSTASAALDAQSAASATYCRLQGGFSGAMLYSLNRPFLGGCIGRHVQMAELEQKSAESCTARRGGAARGAADNALPCAMLSPPDMMPS
eukprot:6181117-Pleurochrysis_carterae.AAC.4